MVYVWDLPYKVSTVDVLDFFGAFGEVLTVERSVSPDFPSLCTGNGVVSIILQESLPYTVGPDHPLFVRILEWSTLNQFCRNLVLAMQILRPFQEIANYYLLVGIYQD